MHVFKLGAAGYIGGSVAAALFARSDQVSGLTRSAEKARRILGWQPKGKDLFHEIEQGCYREFLVQEKP